TMRTIVYFFFSSRRRHTRSKRDWSSDVCSSDLVGREHRVPRRSRFDLAQHLLLDLKILEYRLDHELGPAKPAVVIAPREQRDERSEERRVGKEGRGGWRAGR